MSDPEAVEFCATAKCVAGINYRTDWVELVVKVGRRLVTVQGKDTETLEGRDYGTTEGLEKSLI